MLLAVSCFLERPLPPCLLHSNSARFRFWNYDHVTKGNEGSGDEIPQKLVRILLHLRKGFIALCLLGAHVLFGNAQYVWFAYFTRMERWNLTCFCWKYYSIKMHRISSNNKKLSKRLQQRAPFEKINSPKEKTGCLFLVLKAGIHQILSEILRGLRGVLLNYQFVAMEGI